MAAFFGRWRGVGTANMPRLSRKPGSSWQAWRFWDSRRIKINLVCVTPPSCFFLGGCFLGTAIRIIVGPLRALYYTQRQGLGLHPAYEGCICTKNWEDQTAHLAHSWSFVGELAETRKVGKAETIFWQFKEHDAFSKLLWVKGIERICVGTKLFEQMCFLLLAILWKSADFWMLRIM